MKECGKTIDDQPASSTTRAPLNINSIAALIIVYSAYSLSVLFISIILLAFGVEIELSSIVLSILLLATVFTSVLLLYSLVVRYR